MIRNYLGVVAALAIFFKSTNMKNKYQLLILLACCSFSCKNTTSFEDRNISNIALQKISSFEYEDGEIIRMWADEDFIYCSVSPDNSVIIFDYEGNIQRTLGAKGEAPWENGSIWSFGKDSSIYWVHDYQKMALKKYNMENDSMIFFRRIETKHNIAYLNNDNFLVPHFKSEQGIFSISLYNAVIDSFIKESDICALTKRFDKLPPYGDFTFQGEFCTNDKGQALFYCLFNSAFFFIEDNLSSIEYHLDIRNLPIAEPFMSNNAISLDPVNCGILTASLDDKYIYLLTPKYHEKKWYNVRDYVLDVYDIQSKKYIQSFEMPLYEVENGKYPPYKIAKVNRGLIVYYYGGYIVFYGNFM